MYFFFLQKVFQTRKEVEIKKTVARLPLPAVIPLVEEVRATKLHLNSRDTNLHLSSSSYSSSVFHS